MKISVAMAVYNGRKFLGQQLESIKNQTVKIDEIVIIDDCSKEDSDDLIADFANRITIDVKYIKHSVNWGYANTFFEALDKTTGDYIFFSDQDDVWVENKVEKMIDVVKKSDKSILCLSSLNFIVNQDCEVLKREKQKDFLLKIEMDDLLRGKSLRPGMSLLVSSEIKDKISSVKKDMFFAHDRFIEFVACLNNGFYCLNECLTKYRIHTSNTSGMNLTKTKLRSNRIGRIEQATKEINYFKALTTSGICLPDVVKLHIGKYENYFSRRKNMLTKGVLRYIFYLPLIIPYYSSTKVVFGDLMSLFMDRKFF